MGDLSAFVWNFWKKLKYMQHFKCSLHFWNHVVDMRGSYWNVYLKEECNLVSSWETERTERGVVRNVSFLLFTKSKKKFTLFNYPIFALQKIIVRTPFLCEKRKNSLPLAEGLLGCCVNLKQATPSYGCICFLDLLFTVPYSDLYLLGCKESVVNPLTEAFL